MKNHLSASKPVDLRAATSYFTTAAGGTTLNDVGVNKVFRPMSLMVHPDKGGSTELQALRNRF